MQIGILYDNKIFDVSVTPDMTVNILIKKLRNKFNISTFSSLELRLSGKSLKFQDSVYIVSFNRKTVLELVQRNFFGI
jgi:hypothetical protein